MLYCYTYAIMSIKVYKNYTDPLNLNDADTFDITATPSISSNISQYHADWLLIHFNAIIQREIELHPDVIYREDFQNFLLYVYEYERILSEARANRPPGPLSHAGLTNPGYGLDTNERYGVANGPFGDDPKLYTCSEKHTYDDDLETVIKDYFAPTNRANYLVYKNDPIPSHAYYSQNCTIGIKDLFKDVAIPADDALINYLKRMDRDPLITDDDLQAYNQQFKIFMDRITDALKYGDYEQRYEIVRYLMQFVVPQFQNLTDVSEVNTILLDQGQEISRFWNNLHFTNGDVDPALELSEKATVDIVSQNVLQDDLKKSIALYTSATSDSGIAATLNLKKIQSNVSNVSNLVLTLLNQMKKAMNIKNPSRQHEIIFDTKIYRDKTGKVQAVWMDAQKQIDFEDDIFQDSKRFLDVFEVQAPLINTNARGRVPTYQQEYLEEYEFQGGSRGLIDRNDAIISGGPIGLSDRDGYAISGGGNTSNALIDAQTLSLNEIQRLETQRQENLAQFRDLNTSIFENTRFTKLDAIDKSNQLMTEAINLLTVYGYIVTGQLQSNQTLNQYFTEQGQVYDRTINSLWQSVDEQYRSTATPLHLLLNPQLATQFSTNPVTQDLSTLNKLTSYFKSQGIGKVREITKFLLPGVGTTSTVTTTMIRDRLSEVLTRIENLRSEIISSRTNLAAVTKDYNEIHKILGNLANENISKLGEYGQGLISAFQNLDGKFTIIDGIRKEKLSSLRRFDTLKALTYELQLAASTLPVITDAQLGFLKPDNTNFPVKQIPALRSTVIGARVNALLKISDEIEPFSVNQIVNSRILDTLNSINYGFDLAQTYQSTFKILDKIYQEIALIPTGNIDATNVKINVTEVQDQVSKIMIGFREIIPLMFPYQKQAVNIPYPLSKLWNELFFTVVDYSTSLNQNLINYSDANREAARENLRSAANFMNRAYTYSEAVLFSGPKLVKTGNWFDDAREKNYDKFKDNATNQKDIAELGAKGLNWEADLNKNTWIKQNVVKPPPIADYYIKDTTLYFIQNMTNGDVSKIQNLFLTLKDDFSQVLAQLYSFNLHDLRNLYLLTQGVLMQNLDPREAQLGITANQIESLSRDISSKFTSQHFEKQFIMSALGTGNSVPDAQAAPAKYSPNIIPTLEAQAANVDNFFQWSTDDQYIALERNITRFRTSYAELWKSTRSILDINNNKILNGATIASPVPIDLNFAVIAPALDLFKTPAPYQTFYQGGQIMPDNYVNLTGIYSRFYQIAIGESLGHSNVLPIFDFSTASYIGNVPNALQNTSSTQTPIPTFNYTLNIQPNANLTLGDLSKMMQLGNTGMYAIDVMYALLPHVKALSGRYTIEPDTTHDMEITELSRYHVERITKRRVLIDALTVMREIRESLSSTAGTSYFGQDIQVDFGPLDHALNRILTSNPDSKEFNNICDMIWFFTRRQIFSLFAVFKHVFSRIWLNNALNTLSELSYSLGTTIANPITFRAQENAYVSNILTYRKNVNKYLRSGMRVAQITKSVITGTPLDNFSLYYNNLGFENQNGWFLLQALIQDGPGSPDIKTALTRINRYTKSINALHKFLQKFKDKFKNINVTPDIAQLATNSRKALDESLTVIDDVKFYPLKVLLIKNMEKLFYSQQISVNQLYYTVRDITISSIRKEISVLENKLVREFGIVKNVSLFKAYNTFYKAKIGRDLPNVNDNANGPKIYYIIMPETSGNAKLLAPIHETLKVIANHKPRMLDNFFQEEITILQSLVNTEASIVSRIKYEQEQLASYSRYYATLTQIVSRVIFQRRFKYARLISNDQLLTHMNMFIGNMQRLQMMIQSKSEELIGRNNREVLIARQIDNYQVFKLTLDRSIKGKPVIEKFYLRMSFGLIDYYQEIMASIIGSIESKSLDKMNSIELYIYRYHYIQLKRCYQLFKWIRYEYLRYKQIEDDLKLQTNPDHKIILRSKINLFKTLNMVNAVFLEFNGIRKILDEYGAVILKHVQIHLRINDFENQRYNETLRGFKEDQYEFLYDRDPKADPLRYRARWNSGNLLFLDDDRNNLRVNFDILQRIYEADHPHESKPFDLLYNDVYSHMEKHGGGIHFDRIYDSIKYPDSEVISNYMSIAPNIINGEGTMIMTYGYSGVGKSTSLFGNPSSNGILQVTMEQFEDVSIYLRVFEIYGLGTQYNYTWNPTDPVTNDQLCYPKFYQCIIHHALDTKSTILKVKPNGNLVFRNRHDMMAYVMDLRNPSLGTQFEIKNASDPNLGLSAVNKSNDYFNYDALSGKTTFKGSTYAQIEAHHYRNFSSFTKHLDDDVRPAGIKMQGIFDHVIKQVKGTINNDISSRSILVYDFQIDTKKKSKTGETIFVPFVIYDLPGEEDIYRTYVQPGLNIKNPDLLRRIIKDLPRDQAHARKSSYVLNPLLMPIFDDNINLIVSLLARISSTAAASTDHHRFAPAVENQLVTEILQNEIRNFEFKTVVSKRDENGDPEEYTAEYHEEGTPFKVIDLYDVTKVPTNLVEIFEQGRFTFLDQLEQLDASDFQMQIELRYGLSNFDPQIDKELELGQTKLGNLKNFAAREIKIQIAIVVIAYLLRKRLYDVVVQMIFELTSPSKSENPAGGEWTTNKIYSFFEAFYINENVVGLLQYLIIEVLKRKTSGIADQYNIDDTIQNTINKNYRSGAKYRTVYNMKQAGLTQVSKDYEFRVPEDLLKIGPDALRNREVEQFKANVGLAPGNQYAIGDQNIDRAMAQLHEVITFENRGLYSNNNIFRKGNDVSNRNYTECAEPPLSKHILNPFYIVNNTLPQSLIESNRPLLQDFLEPYAQKIQFYYIFYVMSNSQVRLKGEEQVKLLNSSMSFIDSLELDRKAAASVITATEVSISDADDADDLLSIGNDIDQDLGDDGGKGGQFDASLIIDPEYGPYANQIYDAQQQRYVLIKPDDDPLPIQDILDNVTFQKHSMYNDFKLFVNFPKSTQKQVFDSVAKPIINFNLVPIPPNFLNTQNSCYLNAAVQLLYSADGIRQDIITKGYTGDINQQAVLAELKVAFGILGNNPPPPNPVVTQPIDVMIKAPELKAALAPGNPGLYIQNRINTNEYRTEHMRDFGHKDKSEPLCSQRSAAFFIGEVLTTFVDPNLINYKYREYRKSLSNKITYSDPDSLPIVILTNSNTVNTNTNVQTILNEEFMLMAARKFADGEPYRVWLRIYRDPIIFGDYLFINTLKYENQHLRVNLALHVKNNIFPGDGLTLRLLGMTLHRGTEQSGHYITLIINKLTNNNFEYTIYDDQTKTAAVTTNVPFNTDILNTTIDPAFYLGFKPTMIVYQKI